MSGVEDRVLRLFRTESYTYVGVFGTAGAGTTGVVGTTGGEAGFGATITLSPSSSGP